MLFTSPRDELSCQKLISPPDSNQFTGLCKIQPSGWHIKHQAWGKKNNKKKNGVLERNLSQDFLFFFFMWLLLIIAGPYHSRGFEKHQHSLVPRPENQMAYLSADCTLSTHTHTHTHTHRCRDACGTIEARLLLQPDSSLSGKRDLGKEKPSVRSWPV